VAVRGVSALALLLGAGLLTSAAPARAQVIGEPVDPYPDPHKFARGLYGDAEAGALIFLGGADKSLGTGMAVGARFGFDLFSWAAVQLHGVGSTHVTRFAGRPQDGQLLQIYQGTAELKLAVPIGQWSIAAFGGGGMARLSSNLLGTAGLTGANTLTSPVITGGGGVDYHTRSRHFSFGLNVAFVKLQNVRTTGAVSTAAYVRYTF
jgi:hypothetical protein